MAADIARDAAHGANEIINQLGELDLDSGRNQFLTKGANWRARHVLRKWFVTTCLAVLFVYSTDRPIVGLLYRFGAMQFECTGPEGPWIDANTLYERYVDYVGREYNQTDQNGVEKAPEVSIADLDRFRSDLWCFLNTLKGWKEKVDYWKVRNYYSLRSPYIPEIVDYKSAVAERGRQRWKVAETAAQAAQNAGVKQTRKQWKAERRDEQLKLKAKHGAAPGINPLSGREAEGKGCLTTLRYFNEFLRLSCASDLIDLKLFPDAGEVTESMAVMEAIRRHLRPAFNTKDESVAFVSVADGSTPRTAATVAYLTKWQCHSVDPQLKKTGFEAVIALVHAHVDLVDVLRSIPARELAIIAIPCCDYYPRLLLPGLPPDLDYQDEAVYSPNRNVRVWKNVNAQEYIKRYDSKVAYGR